MKIYLAGPMRNHENHNFPTFHSAAAKLRAKGHEVFNPAEKGCEVERPEGYDALEAMDKLAFRRKVFELDFVWICKEADAVAMLPGWEQSRGAVAEHAAANALGLNVFYLGQGDGWGVAA